jgi:hypothetical protein
MKAWPDDAEIRSGFRKISDLGNIVIFHYVSLTKLGQTLKILDLV